MNSTPVNETVAQAFLDEQLAQARRTFRRTQIFAVASVVFTLGYMSFLTVTLYTKLLQPQPAAELATHYVAAYVQENGTELSERLVAEVPELVAQIPDIALAQLPVMRADLEAKADAVLTQYSREISPQVAHALDEFLANNQEVVRDFLKNGQDPAVVSAVGDQFEKAALAMLHTPGDDGLSAMDRLAQGVEALKVCESRLNRLAHAQDLTPEEKQLRRVIVLILRTAEQSATQS